MVFTFLNKPLPAAGFCAKGLLNYFLVGLFVALFLITFQPFDINLWETPNKLLKLAGFGAVSFLVPTGYSILISLFIPKKILEDQWTVGTEIISICLVLILIAFGNMLYSNSIAIMHISFINFINALIPVVLLGIFPVTFLVVSRHNRLFKRNATQAQAVNQQLQQEVLTRTTDPEPLKNVSSGKLVLIAENEKDKFELEANDLLYIESADNYSNVVFTENGKLNRQLIRGSLKRLETQLNEPFILRCHRTYIVNLNNVIKVEGNAAGYRLFFEQDKDPVPVSRGFGPFIIEKLKTIE